MSKIQRQVVYTCEKCGGASTPTFDAWHAKECPGIRIAGRDCCKFGFGDGRVWLSSNWTRRSITGWCSRGIGQSVTLLNSVVFTGRGRHEWRALR